MLVERLREMTVGGMEFDEAVSNVRASSTFTTHTPVPAGHDTFGREQIRGMHRPGLGRDGNRSKRDSSPSESILCRATRPSI